jgi:hypothetical protein
MGRRRQQPAQGDPAEWLPPDPLCVATFEYADRLPKRWRLAMHKIGLGAVIQARKLHMTVREALESYPTGPERRPRGVD